MNSGDKTSLHIPEDLDKVTISSRKEIADQFAKDNELGKYRDNTSKEGNKEAQSKSNQYETHAPNRQAQFNTNPKVQSINAKQFNSDEFDNLKTKNDKGFELEM